MIQEDSTKKPLILKAAALNEALIYQIKQKFIEKFMKTSPFIHDFHE